jgi:hypothetical protein
MLSYVMIMPDKVIKEMSKQGRCASCGKFWKEFDCLDEIFANLINKTKLDEEEIEALGIIRKIAEENLK